MASPLAANTRHTLAIGVLGAGRLGSALAAALQAHGYARIWVASHRPERARALAASISAADMVPTDLVGRCDAVFLAVPDRAIAAVAADLQWRDGQAVMHSSGALGLEALQAAAARGAVPGCLHPLQTFPASAAIEQAPALFRGIVCGVEAGNAELGTLLEGIARDLGARSVRLEGVDRTLYHAAAVLVSNDLIALAAAATRVWVRAGLPAGLARDGLAPLLRAVRREPRQPPPGAGPDGPCSPR